MTIKVYHNLNECFHSKNFVQNQSIFTDTNIQQIDFNVITGFVHVSFHDKPEIKVVVRERFRTKGLMDMKSFSSGVRLNNGIVSVTSEGPAFDLKSCQHANIEIYVPKKYPHPISFTGVVKTGYISMDGDYSVPIGFFDVIVEAGCVKVKNLNAQSVRLSANVGYVCMKDSIAVVGAKLDVLVGSIKTREIVTKDFIAIAKYGYSRHSDIIADNININTEWGYSSVIDAISFSPLQNININTGYGKSFLMTSNPHLNFTLENKRGQNVVVYEDDHFACNGEKSKSNAHLLNGKCKGLHLKKETKNVAIATMNTAYGSSSLLVDKMNKKYHH